MTTQRPALWPLHDLLGTNLTTPENSLFMQSGYPVGLAVPSADHNGKFRRTGDWHKYLDLNGLRNDDWLDDGSVFLAYSLGGRLSYGAGNVLGAGATVATRGAYLINATRVETDDTFLNPIGGTVQGSPLVYPSVTAPGRIWVYAKDDNTVRYDSVGVGVADSPAADEITLVGVDIDATGVVTDGAVDPVTLPLPDEQLGVVIPLWLFGTGQRLRVSVTPDGTPAVLIEGGAGPGQRIDNDSATDPTLELTNSNATGPALDATGAVSIVGDVTVDGDVTFDPVDPGDNFTVNMATVLSQGLSVSPTTGSSTAITATGDASGPAVNVIGIGSGWGIASAGGTTGDGIRATGGATSGHGVTASASGASSHGVQGTGGNQSTSYGINGIATNTSAYGVRGTSSAAATTSGAGVRAEGLGSAPAISAVAVDGNAARLESDTSSPARAPLVIVPQDADASTTQVGSVAVNSSRLNKIRHYDGSNYLSVHSSANGYVFGISAVSTSSNTTTSGDIGDTTIVSEATGIVVVEVTGTWAAPNDTATLTILLKDITGAVTFATSQAFIAMDRDAEAGNTRIMPFTFRYPYTLPSAGTRLFRYRLNVSAGGAAVNWYDTFMTVQGVG